MQLRPDNASIVADIGGYHWNDGDWLARRGAWDPLRAPINIYELHPGSWRRSWHRKPAFLTWDELADQLIPYVLDLGYTHVELVGVAEHPFDGSWGYQVLGHFAPTARHGTPHDFKRFVDRLHQAGIGVFMDWVPAHFPQGRARPRGVRRHAPVRARRSAHAASTPSGARRSSTTAATKCATSWSRMRCSGSRNITSTACAWMRSPRCSISTTARKHGEWTPNRYGGRENLEAIEFLKQLNWTIGHYFPGVLAMAEESTSFPGVTRPVHLGGLGFHFKWNMGWMNDTLRYMSLDPLYRRHQPQPDHVLVRVRVLGALHPAAVARRSRARQALAARQDAGRRVAQAGELSAADRLHGDASRQEADVHGRRVRPVARVARLRRPRVGGARASASPAAAGVESRAQSLVPRLSGAARQRQQLGRFPLDRAGQRQRERVRVSCASGCPAKAARSCIVAFNCTPVPRDNYVFGVPQAGRYRKILDSDSPAFGGSGYSQQGEIEA